MRIALLHPCYWPEVRRGSERVVHDLGRVLSRHGHEVTLITSHSGPTESATEDGIRVIRTRRPPRPAPLRWYEDHLESTPAMAWHLLRGNFDLAHAFHPAYAWGAAKARGLGAPPLLFSLHGIPERRYLVYARYRLEMLKTAIAGASRVTVLSGVAAELFERYLLVAPEVLAPGIFTRDFEVEAASHEHPTLVFAGSMGDPRKRGELLLAAFTALRERRPDLRLKVVRTVDPFMSPLSSSLPEGAEWVAGDSTEALAHHYASADASVLPSVGEGFGLVVAEALAAGTPAVAVRGGASAELIDEGVTGELFDVDEEGSLIAALERALALGERSETKAVCRKAAAALDWERRAGGYLELYEEINAGAAR